MGFDLGDEDEKKKLEVQKGELEPLTKLKDVLGDKVEKMKMIVSDRIIDSQCVITKSEWESMTFIMTVLKT